MVPARSLHFSDYRQPTASADGLKRRIKSLEDFNIALQNSMATGKPVMLDFYADWCGPCKIAGPILEELAEEYAGKVYIYKVNTESER